MNNKHSAFLNAKTGKVIPATIRASCGNSIAALLKVKFGLEREIRADGIGPWRTYESFPWLRQRGYPPVIVSVNIVGPDYRIDHYDALAPLKQGIYAALSMETEHANQTVRNMAKRLRAALKEFEGEPE
jgi:hypothetical protein